MPPHVLSHTTQEQRLIQLSRALEALRKEIESDLGATDVAHLERISTLSRRLELLGRGLLHFSFEPLGFSAGVLTLWAHKCLEQMEIGHASRARPHADSLSDIESDASDSTWGATARALGWLGLTTSMNQHLAEAVDIFSHHARGGARVSDRPRGVHHQVHESALSYLAKAVLSFPALGRPFFWKVALGNLLSELARDLFASAMTEGGRIAAFSNGAVATLEGQVDWHVRQLESARDLEVPYALSILCGGLDKRIEHHLFPRLPPNRLRQLAPRVRALCTAHGVTHRSAGLRELVSGVFGRARSTERSAQSRDSTRTARTDAFTAAAAQAR